MNELSREAINCVWSLHHTDFISRIIPFHIHMPKKLCMWYQRAQSQAVGSLKLLFLSSSFQMPLWLSMTIRWETMAPASDVTTNNFVIFNKNWGLLKAALFIYHVNKKRVQRKWSRASSWLPCITWNRRRRKHWGDQTMAMTTVSWAKQQLQQQHDNIPDASVQKWKWRKQQQNIRRRIRKRRRISRSRSRHSGYVIATALAGHCERRRKQGYRHVFIPLNWQDRLHVLLLLHSHWKEVERLVKCYDLVSGFQLSNSPEMNVLDLGIWQWMVDELTVSGKYKLPIRRRDADALENTVSET